MTTRKKRPANPYTQPIVPQVVTAPEEKTDQVERENDKTTERQIERENDKTTERQNEERTLRQDDVVQQQPKKEAGHDLGQKEESPEDEKVEQEKATIEVRLYLTQTLDDKLLDLRQEYKRRTGGKRIKPNEIMRKLIEKATIEDIL